MEKLSEEAKAYLTGYLKKLAQAIYEVEVKIEGLEDVTKYWCEIQQSWQSTYDEVSERLEAEEDND